MNFKLDPIKRLAFFLIMMACIASYFQLGMPLLWHALASIGFGAFLHTLYTLASKKPKNTANMLITVLLIFLLLHPTIENIPLTLLATFFAITIKFFVSWKGSPIVNPTVAGLLMATGSILAFNAISGATHALPFVSWWGTDFQGYLSLGLLALWVLGGLNIWRKWWLIGVFLLAMALFMLLRGLPLETLQYAFTHSTLYFLATVMLVDPKTSPMTRKTQIVYALVAALSYNLYSHFGISYFELFAIATANLSWAAMRRVKFV